MQSILRRIHHVAQDPSILSARIVEEWTVRRARWAERRSLGPLRRRLARQVLRDPPVELPLDGPITVHTLLGRSSLIDALYTLKRLSRQLSRPLPIVIHEDGTLRRGDHDLLARQLIGCRVLRRSEWDERMKRELRGRRLPCCAQFRAENVFAAKLLDLQLAAEGRRVLYIDSDVIVWDEPRELVAALEAPADTFADRYAEDVRPFYTLTDASVRSVLGTGLPAVPVNAGLLVAWRPELQWERLEACLALGGWGFHTEQTLWAAEFAARGATPLPRTYDVSFRHAWGEDRAKLKVRSTMSPPLRPVVAQHYSGGGLFRRMFYLDAIRDEPMAAHPRGSH